MLAELSSISIEVENFALVTHKVPAQRVRRVLPDQYELQTFTDEEDEYCFVSATCFCNRDFRLTALGLPRHSFNETTYRTYINYKGTNAVFFFTRYLGSPIGFAAQRVLDRNAVHGDFDLSIDGGDGGYRSYVAHVRGARGDTSFSIEALDPPAPKGPFASGEEHAQFITFRLDGHFMSTAGVPAHGPVQHAPFDVYEGKLHAGRFEPWAELGVLDEDEFERPYSVLVAPGRRFLLYPPRPALR